jgi:CRISPR/Cas system-associated endoribonuclease Cas2
MDYIFFLNANMKVVDTITEADVLPDPIKDDGIVVVLHSGFHRAKSHRLPFEKKQKKSLAYMKEGKYYVQGSFNGGTSAAYLALVRQLERNIQIDLDNNIIAVWHDESHLNRYVSGKHPKFLSPAYAYSEGAQLGFKPKILMLDKRKLGGHKLMRGQKESVLDKLRHKIKKWRKWRR